MSDTCQWTITSGANKGRYCGKKVSKQDSEGKHCCRHYTKPQKQKQPLYGRSSRELALAENGDSESEEEFQDEQQQFDQPIYDTPEPQEEPEDEKKSTGWDYGRSSRELALAEEELPEEEFEEEQEDDFRSEAADYFPEELPPQKSKQKKIQQPTLMRQETQPPHSEIRSAHTQQYSQPDPNPDRGGPIQPPEEDSTAREVLESVLDELGQMYTMNGNSMKKMKEMIKELASAVQEELQINKLIR